MKNYRKIGNAVVDMDQIIAVAPGTKSINSVEIIFTGGSISARCEPEERDRLAEQLISQTSLRVAASSPAKDNKETIIYIKETPCGKFEFSRNKETWHVADTLADAKHKSTKHAVSQGINRALFVLLI